MKHKLGVFLILAVAALLGEHAFAAIRLSVNIAPPPIAVFDQPPVQAMGTSGRLVTINTATMATTGFRVNGLSLPPPEISGRRAIGVLPAVCTAGTRDTGDRK